MSGQNEIVKAETGDIMSSGSAFEHTQRVAKMFASSEMVPQHLRGKVADVTIALAMARQLNENPIVVMQALVVINGKAGWMTNYMIARANKAGVFRGRICWRSVGEGANLAVTAFAALSDTGTEVTATASMAMANAEGWTRNPKYKSMPEHMLRYRSAAMLIRLYCPEVMLGYQTSDEIEDVTYAAGGNPQGPALPPASAECSLLDEFPPTSPETAKALEEVNAELFHGEVVEDESAAIRR